MTSRSHLTFRVSHLAVSGRNVTMDLNGSTITAKPAAAAVVTVTGSNAVLANITVDAKWAAHEAILWTGANGSLRTARLANGSSNGLVVSHAAAVTATAVTATHFANVCFDVTAGTLITHGDRAAYCGYVGFYFSSSSRGNVLDGSTAHNDIGAVIKNRGGHIRRFVSNDDNHFGLLMDTHAANWSADYVETNNTGLTKRIPQGAGVELIGASHNAFRTIISNRNPGYALALTRGSVDNSVAWFSANNTGGWNSNPGLLIDTGSDGNRIAQAAVTGHSVCVHIGETYPYTPSVGNWVGSLTATRCAFDAIRIDYGNHNQIGRAIVVGCGAISNLQDESYLGTVDFARRSANNSIGYLDERSSGTRIPDPQYAVYFGPKTHGNQVDTGRLLGWTARPTRDNGHNYAPFDVAGNPLPQAGRSR